MNHQIRDTTRGLSNNIPEEYKRDDLVQVWLDSRHLATLMKWIENQGKLVRFKSEIVRTVVEQVVFHLIDKGEVEMIGSAEQAMNLLKVRFGVEANPSGRGMKNRDHNLKLDGLRVERNHPMPPPFSSHHVVQQAKVDTNNRVEDQTTPLAQAIALRAKLEAQMKLDEKDEIAKELADVMANADVTVCEKTGRKIITPRGVPRGVITEKDMEEINMEKEEREAKAREEVKEKREQEKLKKKREKLLAELDELDDEIVEKEDDTPIERTYDEIVEDRMNKEKVQLDKLSIANDPMFCDKTKVSDNG